MIPPRVKSFLRAGVFALLRFSGLPALIRETRQRNRVTIVVYHALEAERAREHFAAFKSRYNIISLSQFMAVRSGKTIGRLPPKSLIITFDDGHKSNYGLTPLIQAERIPLTIFLCSGIVGTNRHYWWLHAQDGDEAQRLKGLPDEQRTAALFNKGYADGREYEVRHALSHQEISEMKAVVDFQSHTVFHPILPACTNERVHTEIIESKVALEKEHGLSIYALAYPNGDYSDREVEILKQAGYSCGLTLDDGFNDSATDLYRLRRVALPDDAGVNEVLVKTSGLWSFLKGFQS